MSSFTVNVDNRFLEKLGFAVTVMDYMIMIEPDILATFNDKNELFLTLVDCAIHAQGNGFSSADYKNAGNERLSDVFDSLNFKGKRKISPDVVSLAASIKTDSDTLERGYSVLQDSITDGQGQFKRTL